MLRERLLESDRRLTPTAATHYNPEEFHYHLHDLSYNSEELAFLGDPDQAAFNLYSLFTFQSPDGFLPNQVLTEDASRTHVERWTFNDSRRSDYTQPPVMAQAVKATADSFQRQGREAEALAFKQEIYQPLSLAYDYHDRFLRFSDDCSLAFMPHPHASGRDRDPILNGHKKFPFFLERNGKDTHPLVDLARVPVDWVQGTALNVRQRLVGWDLEKARRNYCRVDPEYNVHYVQNLYILSGLAAELGYEDDAARYFTLAEEVEADIKKWLWDGDAVWPKPEMQEPGQKLTRGLFLAMDGDSSLVYEVSNSSLSPMGLRSLEPQQVKACVRLSANSFDTFVPWASLPKDSYYYDPYYQMRGLIHQGSAWAYQLRFHADNFRMQASREWRPGELDGSEYLPYVCEMMSDIAAGAAKEVFLPLRPEFVNPETGEPQRYPKVSGFGMSGQAELMVHHDHLRRLLDDSNYFKFTAAIGRLLPLTELAA